MKTSTAANYRPQVAPPQPQKAIDLNAPQGVSIIPYRKGLFAISRRHLKLDVYPGYWQFPGGRVEPGENPRRAAVRELYEETGVKLDTESLCFLGTDYGLIGYKGETYNGHRYFFNCSDDVELQHTEPEKHSPWFWVTLSELSGCEMLDGIKEYAAKTHLHFS